MPKVTDDYLVEKRKFILECTNEILKEKPLYLITMRDIIKRANFSQGTIYRYYTNIDEIYVDLINNNTTYNFLEQRIDILINSEQSAKVILSKCILAMGEYIEELLKSVGGKICFELIVTYAYDFEKRATVFPQLKFKQSLEYAQNKIVEYTMSNIDKGVFSPQIPIHSIVMFTNSFIDGIAQSVATGMKESDYKNSELAVDVAEMFQTLAKAIIGFLGE